MKQIYKNFEIEVFDELNYILNSINNLKQYNNVYCSNEILENQLRVTSQHSITIKEFGIEISSAIICEVGGKTGIYDGTYIIQDDKIWIRICNKIYCLIIPTLELIWHKEFDSCTIFSIYNLEDDIIIHGELEIFRITKEGEIVWSFGGRDIWVNPEGYNEVTIEDNAIRLFDFQSNEYVIDFNGKQIEDNPRVMISEVKRKWWEIFG